MAQIDFFQSMHATTKRDYVQRVVEFDKAECSEIAKQYGPNYWDGDRRFGYGGYKYMPGWWKHLAEQLIKTYSDKNLRQVVNNFIKKSILWY